MPRFFAAFVLGFVLLSALPLRAEPMILQSPNGRHCITFDVEGDELFYLATYKEKPTILRSRLGFLLEDGSTLIKQPYFTNRYFESVRKSWKPVFGERAVIPENYNQLTLVVEGDEGREMALIFRAYDEGVAFCYEFRKPIEEGKPMTFGRELTEFVLAKDYLVWATYSAQGAYEKVPVSRVKPGCRRPLLIEIDDDVRLAIGEARLVNFARMLFEPSSTPNGLAARLGSKVVVEASEEKPFRTPWRYIAAADRTGDLLEQNYLILNLNDPCAIEDSSWIKPGKAIREVTLTTAGGKACVDFAVDRGLQYIEYDAGWYGHEYDDASDATTATLDPKRNPNPDSLNLQEVIDYADSKGVGVLVYVNRRALEKQLDDILPLYKKWGVKGMKFGFVNVGSQQWTTWLHESIEKCAEYQMVVDVHDEHRDTGWCRTYPNLLTVEGIRGNEEMPPPEQNVILSMTRMLCGIADYTPCWYTNRVKTSQAHQLALPIVFYSPLTFLYWYDRPSMYKGEPALDLWKELPTVWDDTKVLIDDIPNTVAVARRSGETWYVGILNAGEQRTVKLPITSLLEPGRRYRTTVYSDKNPDGDDREIAITDHEISNAAIELRFRANGGGVLKITPRKCR